MEIKRLRAVPFGNRAVCQIVTGWALYEPGKGYYAFSSDRDRFGILSPYIPRGGKKALQDIIDAGGFLSLDEMEFVNPVEVQA